MGVLTIPLGLGINNNPVTLSPFVDVNEVPDINPFTPPAELLTEDGFFILAEDSSFITTE